MRKLTVLLILALLTGCSSGSKKSAPNEAEGVADLSDVKEQKIDKSSRPKGGNDTPTLAPSSADTSGSSPRGALSEAIKSGSDEQIKKASNALLSTNPNDVYALNALAVMHYKRGEFTASQLFLEKALKLSPRSSDLYNNLGLVQLGLKEERLAIGLFRKALSLNSSDPIAAANLGALYLKAKDYSKALIAMEIAAARSKDNKIMMNYAVALVANRKIEKAEGVYQYLMRNTTNDVDIMFNFAILLIDHSGKNQEGLDLLNKIRFIGPSSETKNKINALENKAKAGLK